MSEGKVIWNVECTSLWNRLLLTWQLLGSLFSLKSLYVGHCWAADWDLM